MAESIKGHSRAVKVLPYKSDFVPMKNLKTIIRFLPKATLKFQEVSSSKGLPTGYQIWRNADCLDTFIKGIAWKHYLDYGLELRYIVKTEVSPGLYAFTAHLFKKSRKQTPIKSIPVYEKNEKTKLRRTKKAKLKRTRWQYVPKPAKRVPIKRNRRK